MEILDIQGLFLYVYIIPNYAYFYKSIHTLPSSTTANSVFVDGSYTKAGMMNGSHSNGVVTSYGSYYNIVTLTAGTMSGTSMTSGSASVDICPKNWNVPALSQQQGLVAKPTGYTIVYAGFYHNSSNEGLAGTRGYWWSRTINSNCSAYYIQAYNGSLALYSYSTGSSYGVAGARDVGKSLRCLAK